LALRFSVFLPVFLVAACQTQLVEPTSSVDVDAGRVDVVDQALHGEQPLEVLFAPDDAPLDVEVALIRAVTDERRADSVAYDGVNPYRIRYAVYNLRNADIVDALNDARSAGVDVQVLIEDGQLDPARDWNWADEFLVEQGWSFEPDHRDLDEEARRTTELVGIGGSGLMHLKLRLFESPTRRLAASGSMNPGDNAVFNDETWHLIRDPSLVDAYAAAYDELLYDKGFVNTWNASAGANVLFTPHVDGPAAGDRILQWLSEEDEQILLMVYSLRDLSSPEHADSLVDILADRVKAGVPVVLVTDRKQSDAWGDTTEDRLRDVGVRVYEATNGTTEFTAMHHKVAVLGRTDVRVITDAANWSSSGLGSASSPARNVESSLFIESSYDGGHLGRRYLAQTLQVLERYAEQSIDDGEAAFADLGPELWSHAEWPQQPVQFVAHEAHTAWGESIRVVGGHDALDGWGLTGGGVPLATDADSYPTWTGGDRSLPVGQRIPWKLVAEQGGMLRWETGDDRVLRVAPEPFTTGTQEITATWR